MSALDNRVEKILVTKEQIEVGTTKAAKWIDHYYHNKKPILVAILKGAIPFYADVLMKVKTDVQIDFVVVTSYKGGVKAQIEPKIITDLKSNVKNRHVILIDDVCDTGKTIEKLFNVIKSRKAASVKLMVLADKPSLRVANITPDFKCFTIGNEFLVGYGLDFKESMRNLPYIGVLKKSLYTKALDKQSKKTHKNDKSKTVKSKAKKSKSSKRKKISND